MKKITLVGAVLVAGGLLGGTTAVGLDKPKISVDEFRAKLRKDESPLPAGGQIAMSYANVADKILPSVVTITSSAPVQTPSIDDIPPQLRPFFYRFFGNPFGEDGMGDDQDQDQEQDGAPAPRRGPRSNPKTTPRKGGEGRKAPEQRGVGSGIIVSSDGYILTNNHVVKDADKIEVTVDQQGQSKDYKAEVIGTDPLTDVALLKVEATGLTPATIGNSTKLRVGDVVLAAGAPMELSRSITMGIVSALGRSDIGIVHEGEKRGFEDFIQTDASINPGNSGGPLVDGLGRVVGINTAILSQSGMNAGIGFAIPVNMALSIVEDLLDDGKVQRGYLGVQIRDLDEETATGLGVPNQKGAVVTMVGSGSPAEKAGVEVGDVIVAADGTSVDGAGKLRLVVSSHKPGMEIPLEVLRGKEKVTLKAKLETLPEEALAGMRPGETMPRGGAAASSELIAGVVVQDLTAGLRDKYKIAKDVQGVVATKVDENSGAAAVGLQEGDVIQAINREPVTSVAEARAQVKSKEDTVFLKVRRKGDTMLFVVRD